MIRIRQGSGLFVAAAILAVMAACASTVRTESGGGSGDVATNHDELIGGDAGSPFNTGTIKIRYGCTATMIGTNQILTAAHCVTVLSPPQNGTQYVAGERPSTTTIEPKYAVGQSIAFTNSATAVSGSNWFSTTILGVDLSPTFAAACASGCLVDFAVQPPYPPDMAVITVADTFPDSFGFSAVVTGSGLGDVVTETGYGCTESVDKGPTVPAFFKSALAKILNPASATDTAAPGFSISNIPAFSLNYYLTAGQHGGGNASLCPGDSGGPLFRGPLATYYSEVTGVNAYYFFARDDSGISTYNVFTRLDTQDALNLFANTTKYAAPTGRGKPVNTDVDPVSTLFPVSTVGLETPGTEGCTGVILTQNSILTAAHCNVGATTIVHFYGSDRNGSSLPILDIAASSDPNAVTTQGVTCKQTDLTFPDSCFIPSLQGGSRHNADLAVLKLSAPIPIGFSPVVLGPKGYGGQGFKGTTLPVWWEVTTGGPALVDSHSREEWAPVTYDETSDTDQPQGYFFIHSLYGLWGDSGGPVFQAPSLSEDAGAGDAAVPDGGFFMPMTVVGLVSDIGPCLGTDTCEHLNMVVSVTQPDNYDWLVGLGGSPVPALATFGASR